ncbi:MAG TPA: diacylglycerol kinase family lipid kinase, partial [Jatrophihabitantaceae bacterium]
GRVSWGAEDRWFVFAAGMGFDAAVVAGVERARRTGKKSTHLLYARVGAREFFRADRRHPRVHVELPDGTRFDDVYFALVTNTDPWTYLGARPLRPTPEAGFDTGLALYARRRMSTVGLLFSIARLSGESSHVGRRGAHVVHDLSELTVLADEPLPVQVDGDYLGTREKLVFDSAPRAVNVLI